MSVDHDNTPHGIKLAPWATFSDSSGGEGFGSSDSAETGSSSSSSSSGHEADIDNDSCLDDQSDAQSLPEAEDGSHSSLVRLLRCGIEELYNTRYFQSRTNMPHGPATLPYVLSTLKHDRPDEFRKHLRVTPLTFDRIVAEVVDDSVFSNNSQNTQIPIEHQFAIALYRFGHFGNGTSVSKVAA